MKASELIIRLQELMEIKGYDPEVLGQSHGCCYHGHEIISVDCECVDGDKDIIIHV